MLSKRAWPDILPGFRRSAIKDFIKKQFPALVGLRRRLKAQAKTRDLQKRAAAIVALEAGKKAAIRQKDSIRVAFVISFSSVWKLDHLYELMQADPQFSPCIVIAPIIDRDESWSRNEVEANLAYHRDRAREVHVGQRDDAFNRRMIADIAPDVVFATNPFSLIPDSLHLELLESHLMCYVPYHIEVGRYDGDQGQYNSYFHNAAWKIFSPHQVSRQTFEAVQLRRGKNVTVTGYPGIEPLLSKAPVRTPVWKPGPGKRVIWAPHHTINTPKLPYSNFLEYAERFKALADEYTGRLRWCFKPHPLLYPKLLDHPDWGKERTDAYFEFWKSHESSQLETGDYIDLFRDSDAMVHDSGSFLAEYLYVDKPVLYMWSSPEVTSFFNGFGLEALEACARADDWDDIQTFLDDLIADEDRLKEARAAFLDQWDTGRGLTPSEKILDELRRDLTG